jgi:hypothetical protein
LLHILRQVGDCRQCEESLPKRCLQQTAALFPSESSWFLLERVSRHRKPVRFSHQTGTLPKLGFHTTAKHSWLNAKLGVLLLFLTAHFQRSIKTGKGNASFCIKDAVLLGRNLSTRMALSPLPSTMAANYLHLVVDSKSPCMPNRFDHPRVHQS